MAFSKQSFLAVSQLFFSYLANGITYDLEATSLETACNDLEDGYHWIRPIAGTSESGDEYPNIYVYCNDGWTVIDPSLVDRTNIQHPKHYFTSFNDATEVVASSLINEHVTWREWWVPGKMETSTQYRIAPDCQTCTSTDDFGENSVYYLTGNYVGCLWITKGYCDMDPDSLECYECSAPGSDEVLSGLCTHMIADADREVNTAHDDCVGTSYNAEPSIGTNGEYCVCYKPENSMSVTPAKWEVPEETITISSQTSDTIVQLRASDFATGTYRITEPGYYIIMEDIEFNMNEGDYDSPNEPGSWYPSEEQAEYYSGADENFNGPYSMGFFAGIAIETEGVTIDLNGYELKMGKAFHIQQRWFSIIEIGSKAFISGQGPGLFGAFMDKASSVEIRDGVLGRSSHHGIHGNNPTDVVIKNVIIKDFEVGGIAINGFSNLRIENVEIGPVYMETPVLGVYTQARIMLSRLKKIYEDNPEGTVKFHDRTGGFTAHDIREELADQMDIVFEHYVNGIEWEDFENQERTQKARDLFENLNQVPSASTVYGMFLNSNGASVFSVGGAPGTSTNVVVKNVKVSGLYNDPWEVPRLVLTKGPFNDIMDLTRVTDNGLDDLDTAVYVGSAYTDAQYALHMLTESWTILGHSVMKNRVQDWIKRGKALTNAKMRCNNDIMLHVTKGVFGIRLDNVENFEIDNVELTDLQNVGQLGSYVCGNWESEESGGHRNQNYPLQHGYTGTEVHAMSFVGSKGTLNNIKIKNVVSARGDVHGIQFFPGNEIELGKNIEISDLHAGAYLYEDELPEDNMPNKIPRACVVDFWDWFDEDSGFSENVITYDLDGISAKCTSFHAECGSSEFDYDLLSEVVSECDDTSLITSDVDTGEVFEEIAETLESSANLMSILQSHGERKRYPHGAFKNPQSQYWLVILVIGTLIAILSIAGYKYYSPKQTLKTVSGVDYSQIDTQRRDTEPLIG